MLSNYGALSKSREKGTPNMCMMNFLKKLDKFLFILRFKNWNSAHFFEVIGRDHKELESI